MLKPGIYEQIINKGISDELEARKSEIDPHMRPVDEAEAAGILSKYVKDIIEKDLAAVSEKGGGLKGQIELVNRILSAANIGGTDMIEEDTEQLISIVNKKNSVYAVKGKTELVRPETSIASSSLFTGAVHEPSMYTELKKGDHIIG